MIMMKDKSAKEMLKFFDENAKMLDAISEKPRDISELIKGAGLMLEQMKLARDTSIKLRKSFKGTDKEFQEKALKDLAPLVRPIQRKLEKIDNFKFNSTLFNLPERKGRIFFEIMAESEEAARLPLYERRQKNDKNIAKMESFVEFLKDFQKKIDEERQKVIKPLDGIPLQVLQIKISLRGIKPLIWRRFLVKNNITFHKLHLIIQRIMGWDNYHLYYFEKGDLRIESEELVDGEYSDFEPSEKIKLCQVLGKGMKIEYVYDFGDNWEHEVVVEKIMEKDPALKYPVCLEGGRNCPPEDCGSVWGYDDLMKIRKNPKHPEYKDRVLNWLGTDYDPEYFDVEEVNRVIQKK